MNCSHCSLFALFGQYEPFALFVVRTVRTIWLVRTVRCSHCSHDFACSLFALFVFRSVRSSVDPAVCCDTRSPRYTISIWTIFNLTLFKMQSSVEPPELTAAIKVVASERFSLYKSGNISHVFIKMNLLWWSFEGFKIKLQKFIMDEFAAFPILISILTKL